MLRSLLRCVKVENLTSSTDGLVLTLSVGIGTLRQSNLRDSLLFSAEDAATLEGDTEFELDFWALLSPEPFGIRVDH